MTAVRTTTALRRAGRGIDILRRRAVAWRIERAWPRLAGELRDAGLVSDRLAIAGRCRVTRSGVAVVPVVDDAGRALVAKLALDEGTAEALRRESAVLAGLAKLPLGHAAEMIPSAGSVATLPDGTLVRLESRLPGRPAASSQLTEAVSQAGLDLLLAIRRAEGTRPAVAEDVDRLIGARVAAIGARTSVDAGAVERAARAALAGSDTVLGRVHGDLWAGNLLVDDAGRLTGVIDWDRSAAAEPDAVDRLHLAATEAKRALRQEVGEVVAERLRARGRDAGEWLMYWCWFAAENLARFPSLGTDAWWVERNIASVVRTVR